MFLDGDVGNPQVGCRQKLEQRGSEAFFEDGMLGGEERKPAETYGMAGGDALDDSLIDRKQLGMVLLGGDG